MKQSKPTPHPSAHPRGFALIASLSIMVLLIMVTVGMLTLSKQESRSSEEEKAMMVARANARLALMLALAQIQEAVGPDQRTTATAGILDDNPFTEEIDGINNPHFLGVWRTDGLEYAGINAGIFVDQNGRLFDKRVQDDKTPGPQCLEWLVSGDVSNVRDPLPGNEGTDFLTIARDPETTDGTNDVKVPLVSIESSSLHQGSYAYWVADENLKAKINLPDPNKDKNPNWSDPGDGGFAKLFAPASNNMSERWTDHNELTEEQNHKILSNESVELALSEVGSGTTFHDFTTHSYSLFTNLRDGGLQQDLTAYLESSSSLPALGPNRPGINDSDPIINKISQRETVSPRFSALKSWYQLSDAVSGPLGNRSIEPQFPDMVGNRVALASVSKQQITPVMTEAMLYMRHTFNNRQPILLYYPRVVLWNPYNVKLQSKGYFVYFHSDKNTQMDIRYQGDQQGDPFLSADADINFNFTSNWERRPIFYLEPTELQPGEALVFTTKSAASMLGGKARKLNYEGSDLRGNVLSAREDPADKYCFYSGLHLRLPGIADWQFEASLPSNTNMDTISYSHPEELTWHGSSETQSIVLYADNASSPVGYRDLPSGDVPEISAMRFDNYSRDNNGRWGPSYTPTPQYTRISDALAAGPDTITHFGGRMRWFDPDYSNKVFGEALREPWYNAPMAFGNVRSPNHFRWLRDNMYGQRYSDINTGTGGARSHLYSYGMIAQTRQATGWLDPAVLPTLSSSLRYRTAVFQSADTANAFRTYPMFEIPNKEVGLFSLAGLTHAQVSRYWWQPTYPIANSLAPNNVPLHTTALDNANNQESKEKSETLSTLILGHNDPITQLSQTSGNPLTTDLSFELNYSLWDRFFLSGLSYSQGSGGWNNGTWPDEEPLPNPRLILNPYNSKSGEFAETADFNKAASSLLINGGFNVNSISVKAWEATLKSFRDITLKTRDGKEEHTSYIFSRFLVPETTGPSNEPRLFNNTYQEDGLWNGYRSLTDEQITTLAENIVRENKRRGPYLTMADFINRRLSDKSDETQIARSSALQTAIDNSPINARLDNKPDTTYNMPKASTADSGAYVYGAEYWGGHSRTPKNQTYETFNTRDSENNTRSKATGAPGYLMASDILQQIGSFITARSDTFVIRAYGDARDANGNIISHAYCEAVIQRTTTPIEPDPATGNLDPIPPEKDKPHFGRKCEIVAFRWLKNDEI
ncbi:hypothetical protein [Rubritalea tangerina]|uniref:Verru_Chthon cassette protein A n=1 Tax=Rubritalea tangerina TaxID=430798 RepID=A0ABW4ZD21_9BACT